MIYFFDTSGLQFRYLNGTHSRGVRRIVSDVRNQCFISEFTVLEISSAFATQCRKASHSITEFERLDRAFWRDVHEGRILVRPVSKTDLLRARHLLRRAAEIGRRLTSADAVIATAAMELALERTTRVTLCLEDWKLYDLVRGVDSYRAALRFKYLGREKAGAIKASRKRK